MLSSFAVLDSMSDESITSILDNWSGFVSCNETLLLKEDKDDLSSDVAPQLTSFLSTLFTHGLAPLAQNHFLQSLQETFKTNAVSKFWQQFDAYNDDAPTPDHVREDWPEEILDKSLEGICLEKSYLEKCILTLVHAFQSNEDDITKGKFQHLKSNLTSRYQLMVSSVLLTTLPSHFPEILRLYFKKKLEELSSMMTGDYEDGCEAQIDDHDFNQQGERTSGVGAMDLDGSYRVTCITSNNGLVKSIGKVVRDLRSLGFSSLAEDAYASAIFMLLKNKVHSLAGDDYRNPVLGSVKKWIQL